MQRKIITTADGSKTIHLADWDEQYHSKHGAVQEALHVFIESGLHHYHNNNSSQEISILEIGFGTGLNAYLTLLECTKLNIEVDYVGIEAYPVAYEEIKQLNYPKIIIQKEQDKLFDDLHTTNWEIKNHITDSFVLTKRQQFFRDVDDVDIYNLIYFDAFGAKVQPELWTEIIFNKMFVALKPNGILVTYSAKGSVRRALLSVGFTVERLQGPPGKREMLRATKNSANPIK